MLVVKLEDVSKSDPGESRGDGREGFNGHYYYKDAFLEFCGPERGEEEWDHAIIVEEYDLEEDFVGIVDATFWPREKPTSIYTINGISSTTTTSSPFLQNNKIIIEHPFQNPSLPHTPSLPSGPCLLLLILFLQHLSRTGIHTETLRVGLTDSNVYSTVGVRPQGIDVA